MKKSEYFSIRFDNDRLIFLDQTKLPAEQIYIETESYETIASAIERLEIRGAPAIGIAAAYGLALAVKNSINENLVQDFERAYARLSRTRPTAVNLFFSLDEMKRTFQDNIQSSQLYEILKNKAISLHNEDIVKCERIAKNGLALFTKKSNVLTHCNTGRLAAAGDGTAFNIIKHAFDRGLVSHVYVDETRPLYQGLRLTAFELMLNSIPFSLNTDSMAAFLMKERKIDLVLVGADRIALNGDTANKIGTYNLAVLCYYHDIPFYLAAPTTTIDRTITSGMEIPIEYRQKSELFAFTEINFNQDLIDVFNPAFDITPAHLITGIVTEEQVYKFPYNFIR